MSLIRRYSVAAALLGWEFVVRPAWARAHLAGHFARGRKNSEPTELLRAAAIFETLEEGLAHLYPEGMDLLRTTPPAPGVHNSGVVKPAAIPARYDASPDLARLTYSLVRAFRPQRVVEIGVARGVTTAAILRALDENDCGQLVSIDFPGLSLGYAREIGSLVPPELRGRWSLRLGPSSAVLPLVLDELVSVDLFVHDGSHTYEAQRSDLDAAVSHLSRRGIAVVDDVDSDALLEIAASGPFSFALMRQRPKPSPLGIILAGHKTSRVV